MMKLSVDLLEPALGRIRPEAFFVVLAVLFGSILVFITAPFEAPDEAAHFWRAYHVYEGELISHRKGDLVGGRIPESVATAHLPFEYLVGHPDKRVDRKVLSQSLQEPFDAGNKRFVCLFFPGLYAPVVYVPQVIGIAIGRLFDVSAVKMMYAGRLMNLLCWIVMVTFAIRMMPVCKWVLIMVALLPMSLSQSASLSADGPTNAMAILLVSLILCAALDKETPLSKQRAMAVILLCILLSMAKQAYAPLTGLVLLIPAARFKDMRDKVVFCSIAIGLALVAAALWSKTVSDLYTPFHGANAPEQLSILKDQPWDFLGIIARTVRGYWRGYVSTFIGTFGFADTFLPNWIYFSYPFVLIGTALFDRGRGEELDKKQRLWMIAICIGVFFLIELSMYLTWTPPGEMIIEGVQGRYFLPIAVPALLALFYNRKLKSPAGSLGPLVLSAYSAVVLIAACLTIYGRFYGPV